MAGNYTSFNNMNGLMAENEVLPESGKAVLSWPDKHCASSLSPKVFTNFKQYDENGIHEVTAITDSDNLIIKGNNLPVLHSLKPRYSGRAKLIYIDPPYNTGSDSFHYKDNLNQSTWLTFIKNRIEVAKELLSNDGFLFFHISFHQFAYVKVLLDEIFNGNNVCTFNLLVRHPDRILKGDKDFHDVMEYLLVYTKNKVANKIAKRVEATDIDKYIYQIQELNAGHVTTINGLLVKYFKPGDYKIIRSAPSNDNLQKISIRGSLKEGNSSGRFYQKHLAPFKTEFPASTIFKIPDMGRDKFDHRYFYMPEEGKSNGGYYQGVPVNIKDFKEKPYPNFLNFVQEFNNVGYEGNVEFRNGKKPEALIKLIFELAKLKQGDLVLDFFAGSGTTAAVAHKMGMQYIIVEQMDYGENDCVHRLASVIKGEQGGISQHVKWQGGGKFIYFELANCNYADMEDNCSIPEAAKKLNHLFYHSL